MADFPEQFEMLYGLKGGKNHLDLASRRVYSERWECVTPAFKLHADTLNTEGATSMQS